MSDERRTLFAHDPDELVDSPWRNEFTARPLLRPAMLEALPPTELLGSGRLQEVLSGVRGGDTLTVVAPIGYGKTSLLNQWAQAGHRPSVVLPLPAQVDLANELLHELLGALAPAAVKFTPRPGAEPSLTADQLHAIADTRALIVIDDVHHAVDPGTVKLLVSLINHLPGHRVLAIAGRQLPALRQRDLQSPHRVSQVTHREMAVRRSDLVHLEALGWEPAALDWALATAGGWPVGVRQALEWYVDHGRLPESEDAWCLSEYYTEEVLEGIAAEDLAFLREVCLLGSADSRLLDAARETTDSADRIRTLRQLVLPLVSIDLRSTAWIGVHPPLANFVAADVVEQRAEQVRSLAALRLEQNGAHGDAFNQLFELSDKSLAVELMARRAPELILRGQASLVRGCLDRFSTQSLVDIPELQLLRAILAALEGEPGTVLMWLDMFENGSLQRLAADERLADRYQFMLEVLGVKPPGRGLAMTLRPDDLWAVGAHIISAFRAAYRGDYAAAESTFQAVAPFCKPHPLAEIWRASGLGWVYWETGRRAMGLQLVTETAEVWRTYGFTKNPTTCQFECLLASYAVESGDLRAAKEHFDNARTKLATLHSALPQERLCATLLLVEVARSLGDLGVADVQLRDATELALQCPEATQLIEVLQSLEALGQDRSSAGDISLSKAELKILRYLPSHYTVPQIAKSLYLSPATVRTQVQAIYRKLGAHHRAEAVEIARSQALID